ncbi:MAG: hypothetical protein WD824_16385 [Cyclobacteriaceae bacterium]
MKIALVLLTTDLFSLPLIRYLFGKEGVIVGKPASEACWIMIPDGSRKKNAVMR